MTNWHELFDEVKLLGRFGSDAQLAEYLGLTRAQISAWRTGKSELGTMVRLKLLDALGHDSLHAVMDGLWPAKNRDAMVRQHASLLERVGRSFPAPDLLAVTAASVEPVPLHANQLLAALPADEQERLRAHLCPVTLPLGHVLYESGDALRHVYLPTTAIISMLYMMDSGASAEFALVGRDGLLGIALFIGGETMPSRAIVQNAGHAYRLAVQVVKEEFARGGTLRRIFLRYTQVLITQMVQTAACNRHHSILQQFCRWLLLSLERIDGNQIPMTQDLIADMLGVRQASVTEVTRKLQDLGVIRYRRGVIEVVDRKALEAAVCECYGVVALECRRLFGSLPPLHTK